MDAIAILTEHWGWLALGGSPVARRATRPPKAASDLALRDERGSMVLEFAVVMPAFCLLLLGLCQFCFVSLGYSSTVYSARRAARFASYSSNTSLGVTGGYGSTPTASAAQTATITAILQQTMLTPGATTPVISITYANPLGAPQTGNYVGNVVYVKATWSEKVGILPIIRTLNVSIEAGRVIVR